MAPTGVHITKDDVGSCTNPLKFLDQDYQELHQNCLTKNTKYIDEFFSPDNSSIGKGLLSDKDMAKVTWKRPSELVTDPNFIVDGASKFDYAQGSTLGNCWFLASIGALTSQMDIMNKVVPAEQSFSKVYTGIFHFRFWRFGKWFDVVVDDKLPTIDGKLIFVHSKTSNEFWPALLEKAYAKVCGSYADLESGFISEALMDFTGGTHMHIDLKQAPATLWNTMECAFKSKTLMGCCSPQGETPENTVLRNGIIEGHSYTVTGVFQVTSEGNSVRLVRLLNPWGQGEWKGAWSDKSPMWKTVSAEDRKKCLSVDDNGEFWMSMEDFTKIFQDMDICCLCPDFMDESSECHWTSTYIIGQWNAGTTAGGSRSYTETFWTNPRFRVRIEKLDKDCARGQCPENILVSLMQNRESRHRKKLPNFFIGFYVYDIPPGASTFRLTHKYLTHKSDGFLTHILYFINT
ncbi:calpain-1 catalytic subunit-like [Xyrauchen texanus]|uniref:calpain-1 catalytic subunit-like n=1 Tax=Xyrauchen texanus TaxID=154827 RepID=UPI002242658E|nr:calpain-1 catalytic subunit-like [Xyrauchen texanus]